MRESLTIPDILRLLLTPGVELFALRFCVPGKTIAIDRDALLDGDDALDGGRGRVLLAEGANLILQRLEREGLVPSLRRSLVGGLLVCARAGRSPGDVACERGLVYRILSLVGE